MITHSHSASSFSFPRDFHFYTVKVAFKYAMKEIQTIHFYLTLDIVTVVFEYAMRSIQTVHF